ncbi:hypothetical protein D3C73_852180 [compost metagenome]
MTDEELLERVKTGLSIDGNDMDGSLLIKIAAVRGFMINAGVSESRIETDLGIASLTVGVSDLWELASGEVKFSSIFTMHLVPQLVYASTKDGGKVS